jgi:hypothetical protein
MQYIVFCNKTFWGAGEGEGVGVGGGVGGRERLVWASGETRDGTPVYTHMQMCNLCTRMGGMFSH